MRFAFNDDNRSRSWPALCEQGLPSKRFYNQALADLNLNGKLFAALTAAQDMYSFNAKRRRASFPTAVLVAKNSWRKKTAIGSCTSRWNPNEARSMLSRRALGGGKARLLRCFRHRRRSWCAPKSNATYDLAQTAALSKGCFLPAGSSGKRKTNPAGSHQATRTEPVVQIFDAKTRAGLRPSHDDEVYCRHCIEPQSCLAPARR